WPQIHTELLQQPAEDPEATKRDFQSTARLLQPRKEISSSRRRTCNHEKRFQVHGEALATAKSDFKFTALILYSYIAIFTINQLKLSLRTKNFSSSKTNHSK